MKKMVALLCVFGFAVTAYAQLGSPVWDAKIMSVGYAPDSLSSAQKLSKEAEKAKKVAEQEIKKQAEQAAAEKAAAVEKAISLLGSLRDANGKAIVGKDFKNRYDSMVSEVEQVNGSDINSQSALYAMENFAAYVQSTVTSPESLALVKVVLSNSTCKVRGQKMSLKEAAEEVNDAAIQAGNGFQTAGLNDEAAAFYKSL